MTSVNLVFHVQEVFLPARNEKYSAFPFAQVSNQQDALIINQLTTFYSGCLFPYGAASCLQNLPAFIGV